MAIPFLNNIDLVKNQLLNAVFQNLAVAPATPVEGQFYYNTTDKKMFYYNGTAWVDTTYLLPIASATVLGGIKVGSGLSIDNNGVLSATGTNVDIINNLTSDRTDAALAAAQGKALKGLIDTLQTAIDGLGTAATKDTGTSAGNIPVLGTDGKLDTSILPALALVDVYTVDSETAMLALDAQQGDVAIRTDENKTYILSKEPASTLANWIELLFPVSVVSVNGKTGIVVLTGDDINVDIGTSAEDPQVVTLNEALKTILSTINKLSSTVQAYQHTLNISSNNNYEIDLSSLVNIGEQIKITAFSATNSADGKHVEVDWEFNNNKITIYVGNTTITELICQVSYQIAHA